MNAMLLLLWLHVIGATVLFGTGLGIAFFMVMAHRTSSPALIAHVAGTVVVADFVFTTTAIVLQPATGAGLAWLIGWSLADRWLLYSLVLYAVAGMFWLPVVVMQRRMRDLAHAAAQSGLPLPASYHRLYRLWFACGFPAFAAVLAIVWLMLAKPSL